ncbi:MAG: DUF1501 domain-containing protein [Acidobacteriota bacterium]
MATRGCNECREADRRRTTDLSRRRFLGWSSAALASATWLPRVARAEAESSDRDVLVSIFLRGGADGLSLCVPHGDRDYYRHRPTLAVPSPEASSVHRALDLDGFFGLSPALTQLHELYRDASLAIVHACGQTRANRSHFAAMHLMEVGHATPPSSLLTGWIGRHLQNTTPRSPNALLRALGMGYGLQRSLVGAPRSAPVADPESFDLRAPAGRRAALKESLRELYAQTSDPLATSMGTTWDTVELLQGIDFSSYRSTSGPYPDSELGRALESSAALIKSEIGIEAIAVDTGGWDTHDEQGTQDGVLDSLLKDLGDSLGVFYRDLAKSSARFTVVVMSEFGRNAVENGSLGTDHGYGSAMMVLGSNIRGGRVFGEWPGLAREQLFDGQDLAVTTDYRQVLAELLEHRFANPDPTAVFDDPSFVASPLGLV